MNAKDCIAMLVVLAALVSASCHGGDGDPALPAPTFSGESLVLDALQSTSDTSEPVAINGQELTFSEDPHAFDALFQ